MRSYEVISGRRRPPGWHDGQVLYEPPHRGKHGCNLPGEVRPGTVWRCTGCRAFWLLRPAGTRGGWYRMRWFPRCRLWLRKQEAKRA